MTGPWIGNDGWPRDLPDGLTEALRLIPGSEKRSDEEIENMARMVWGIASLARDEQNLPRNQSASNPNSEQELQKLHKLCDRLADHIEEMRRPAIEVLVAEGLAPFDLAEKVREAREAARHAFGSLEESSSKRGRPESIEAREVSNIAAELWNELSGQRPTTTGDPDTGRRSQKPGSWPAVLDKIYNSLRIKASVDNQAPAAAKKLSKKIRRKNGN